MGISVVAGVSPARFAKNAADTAATTVKNTKASAAADALQNGIELEQMRVTPAPQHCHSERSRGIPMRKLKGNCHLRSG